jgi:hypothetical protein
MDLLLGTKYFGRNFSVTSKQINVTFLLSKIWHLPPFKNLESSPLLLGDCLWAKLPCGNLFNFSSFEYLLQLSIFRYLTFRNDEFDSDSG